MQEASKVIGVLDLTVEQLRQEVAFWRVEAASMLETMLALHAASSTAGGKEDVAGTAWLQILPLRSALQAALQGEYHMLCETCGQPLIVGEMVVTFDDVGEVHASHYVTGEDLRAGFEIPIDAAMLSLEEGEEPPANPVMIVHAIEDLYTPERILESLAAAWAIDAEPACRICGCTEDAACETPDGPCHWVEDDLCSNPDCIAAAAASDDVAGQADHAASLRDGAH